MRAACSSPKLLWGGLATPLRRIDRHCNHLNFCYCEFSDCSFVLVGQKIKIIHICIIAPYDCNFRGAGASQCVSENRISRKLADKLHNALLFYSPAGCKQMWGLQLNEIDNTCGGEKAVKSTVKNSLSRLDFCKIP